MSEAPIVVVGGGQAAVEIAAGVRSRGYQGPLLLISDEDHLPYQRPPLSKAFLQGTIAREKLLLRPAAFFESHRIEVRLAHRAAAIDRTRQEVQLEGAAPVSYSRLARARGARARPIGVPGDGAAGVFYLRTLRDVEAIRASLAEETHVAIIGGGFIGLETAAILRKLERQVTVIEALDRIMARVSSPSVSAFYQDYHEQRGVRFHLGRQVRRFALERGRLQGIEFNDGEVLPARIAIVGVGVLPNIELAAAAGLACDAGISVDEYARTEDAHIVAAGDCTNHPNNLLGRRLRLESVHNAVEQARTAAATLCGMLVHYSQIPWFWSDQYDLKLQMCGIPTGFDTQVRRAGAADNAFSIFYFKDHRFIAADSINRPGDHIQARRLLTSGIALTPEQAADPAFELKSLK